MHARAQPEVSTRTQVAYQAQFSLCIYVDLSALSRTHCEYPQERMWSPKERWYVACETWHSTPCSFSLLSSHFFPLTLLCVVFKALIVKLSCEVSLALVHFSDSLAPPPTCHHDSTMRWIHWIELPCLEWIFTQCIYFQSPITAHICYFTSNLFLLSCKQICRLNYIRINI